MYRAGACDRWLNYTMLEYRWTPRFIDYRFGLSGTEHLILEFMKVIERIKGQERCREILKALLCEYFLPPCNEENEPYKFCREDCEAVFETCHTAMMELVGAAKYFVEELGDNLGHAEVPDCEKHRYSAEYKAENSTCVHFGLFSKSTPIATLIILITIATTKNVNVTITITITITIKFPLTFFFFLTIMITIRVMVTVTITIAVAITKSIKIMTTITTTKMTTVAMKTRR